MMKLTKNSIANNTQELPDNGALVSGSNLHDLSDGRYYTSDLSTMVNFPQDLSGIAVLKVYSFNEENELVKTVEVMTEDGTLAYQYGTISSDTWTEWFIYSKDEEEVEVDTSTAGEIILAGSDFADYNNGYVSLESDLILTKDEAPKLWELYSKGGSYFISGEKYIGSGAQGITQISNTMYMQILSGVIYIADNFEMSEAQSYNLTSRLGTNNVSKSSIAGVNMGGLIAFASYSAYSTTGYYVELTLLDYSSTETDVTNFIASMTDTTRYIPADMCNHQAKVALTNNYIVCGHTTNDFNVCHLDNIDDMENSYYQLTTPTGAYYEDFTEAVALKNDYLFQRGSIYNLANGDVTLIYYWDTGAYIGYFHKEGLDYVSYSNYNMFSLDSDGNIVYNIYTNLEGNDNGTTNSRLMDYRDNSNYLLASNAKTLEYKTEDGVQSTVDSELTPYDCKAASHSYWYYPTYYMSYVTHFSDNIIVNDIDDLNIAYQYTFTEEKQETFTINAVTSDQTDKKYFIKVQ